ncbi:putative subtilisin-like protease [Ophiocordyceps camponoti-leonardi (nom. inval.)]|nr:putative subtilisin-like protease [Ophiocordyceps camponoti-leonardi (nom. inval.)]
MVRPAALLTLAAAAVVAVSAPAPNGHAGGLIPGAYILELEQGEDHETVLREVNQHGATRMQLDYKLFRGVSFQLSDMEDAPHKMARLAAMPAVRNVWPVRLYKRPNVRVEWTASEPESGSLASQSSRLQRRAERDNFSPHVMTQVDQLREKGVTGKGTRIAVIDSGVSCFRLLLLHPQTALPADDEKIDYLHPALGGCFGSGCLVSFGRDYVGDAYNGTNTPMPGPTPMDCLGHGTHVAGIVAAQAINSSFSFTGAAPDVTLGAYRVFGCKGEVTNEVLIAAFNQAYEDGADIITASIGSPNGWPEEPWTVAVSRIVDNGVPCTISAGNEGDNGLLYASGAAAGKGVISVASTDNVITPTLLYRVSYTVDGGPDKNFSYVPADPDAWDEVTMELRATSLNPTLENDACNPIPGNGTDFFNRVALIRRGNCTFSEKAANVARRGARYVLFYNNDAAGALSTDLTSVPTIAAGGMVLKEVGEAWIAEMRAGRRVVIKMASPKHAKQELVLKDNDATGGAISTFSSWGPSWEMDVKPQFSSPGGSILSTYPRKLGGYAVLSGTSMACPLVAAIIALVGQVRGSFDPDMLSNVLSSTARTSRFNSGKNFSSYLAPVAQQGGGLVQAFDAAYAHTLLSPQGLSFNDTDHFASKVNFTVKNVGHKPVSYRLSHKPAVTMYTLAAGSNYPQNFPNDVVEGAKANISLSCETLTLSPGESALVEVKADPPPGLDARRLALWSGWVAVNSSDGLSFSIPYQGLTGSLHRSQVLAPDAVWISRSTDKKLKPVAANTTFVLPAPGKAWQGVELPSIVVNPALGSPLQAIDIVSLATKTTGNDSVAKTIGQPSGYPSAWVTRGKGGTAWDGLLASGLYAPPGLYKFVVRALHIFGDARNSSDWDVSESVVIRIQYT